MGAIGRCLIIQFEGINLESTALLLFELNHCNVYSHFPINSYEMYGVKLNICPKMQKLVLILSWF